MHQSSTAPVSGQQLDADLLAQTVEKLNHTTQALNRHIQTTHKNHHISTRTQLVYILITAIVSIIVILTCLSKNVPGWCVYGIVAPIMPLVTSVVVIFSYRYFIH